MTRSDRKSQVRKCLGFCTADFGSSLAYESAKQKPKHCLISRFLMPLPMNQLEAVVESVTETFSWQVIPRDQGFSTNFGHLKNIFFASVLIGIEVYAHYFKCYHPLLMLFFGFWAVFVGVNIGHEGCHGSASRRGWVNLLYRWGWSLMGESTLHWIQFHTGTTYTCALLVYVHSISSSDIL